MFGEEPLFGPNKVKIDSQNRICIPANTKRESGEELVIVYNSNLKVYEIYSAHTLGKKFKKIVDLIDSSKNRKEKQFYERMLKEFSKSILIKSKVDATGRILTGKLFEDYDEISCIGAYDRLIIEPKKK